MSRLHSFDYIRVIALFGILTCHSLFLFDGWDWLGRYFAQCFNFVFLILSAFLLGLSWERHEQKSYNVGFLKHRFGKLSWSYYPFLIIMFVFLGIVGYHFSVKDVVMYVLYLAWFDKIPGFGHVWFLTMMAFAYIGVYLYTRYHNSGIKGKISRNCQLQWFNWLLLIMTIIIIHVGITSMHLPGYMILYLALYVIVFRYLGSLLQIIGKSSMVLLIVAAIISHGTSLILYKHGLFANMYISPVVGIINGVTLFAVLFRLFELCHQNRAIAFISGISFESYLIHEFYLYNTGIYGLNYPPLFIFLIFSVLVIASGWVLREIVNLLRKFLPQIFKFKRNN